MHWLRYAPGAGAVALTALLVACNAGSHTASPEVGTLHSTGDIVIAGEIQHPTQPVHLHTGDEVTITTGSATVTLPCGGVLSMVPGTQMQFGTIPKLEAG